MFKCHSYSPWWSRIGKLSYWKRNKEAQSLRKSLWQPETTTARDNQKSISEVGNSVEPSPSLSRSFWKKKRPLLCCAICNEDGLSENLRDAGSYHAKRKVVNVQRNKNFREKWKEMTLNSDNLNILALISTVDLAANEIFYHASCYKSMQYKSDKFKRDKSSTD